MKGRKTMADTDFDILETLALRDGGFVNLERHLARMREAARHFARPCADATLEQALQGLRQAHGQGDWRVRLALDAAGRVQTQAVALPASATPVRLALAERPIANAVARGQWVRFKTSRRAHYEALQPVDACVFDTVLHNEDGEITEGTRGNVAVLLDGRWVTPPLSCGLLPGVGRAVALDEGRVAERIVRLDELPRVQGWAFVNSLRGWLDAVMG
ncbi:aminotransferase class IV [Delftia tsuruhatensis]|uniref:aminotransferase class IV n=1 Tax=Delftia tsuruhatensis TaxID=180282 RepID=UPI001F1AC0C3|nr:aminotransferase class IV [Delftia tsuruhatensis]